MPRLLVIVAHAPYLFGARWLVRMLGGRARLERGMSLWHDMLDWLGGWPFEVATPRRIVDFSHEHGFRLLRQKPGRRHGCDEFVFQKVPYEKVS